MTFKSVSTSGTASSKASSLFDLDEHGNKSILVYKYRSGAKGLEVKTERALCEELDKGQLQLQSPAHSSHLHPNPTMAHCSRILQTHHYLSCASQENPYREETAVWTS